MGIGEEKSYNELELVSEISILKLISRSSNAE